ncbi:hypothetical protein VCSRO186_1562 [Vibrio cholerae]|nr:hypothetical protein VCSRO186_1562 [Vibrio cholerae]
MNVLGKSSHAIQFLLAVVVFVLGLGSTAVIYQIIVNFVHDREQVYFEFRAREAVERIKSRMAAYQQVLRGTAGILIFTKLSTDINLEIITSVRLLNAIYLASKALDLPRQFI